VVKNRGHHCGDIELSVYLPNVSDPVSSVLDLHITHDRFGRTSVTTSDPTLNGNLHYPTDIDRSLNEATADKIRKYLSDYNNNPPNPISFYLLLLVRLEGYMVNLYAFYSYSLIGKLTAFLQLQEFSLRNIPVDTSTVHSLK
jgi:hypothetical protein